MKPMNPARLSDLRAAFGDRMQENVPLSGYTAARIGGPADVLITVRKADELAQAAGMLWKLEIPFTLLGGGSNVLVSDLGVRGVVILNRARQLKFSHPKNVSNTQPEGPSVHAETGVTPNDIAQRAARLGLAGFEWACAIPGTLGGAIYGNAGAFDGNMAGNLISVELLHRDQGRQTWPAEKLGYGYRTSLLKREHPPIVLLSAELALSLCNPQAVQAKMEQFSTQRRAAQPPGASMGSMFKNPPDDKAGRLLEAAGLKGKQVGNATISTQHANFFINNGLTTAADMLALIEMARKTVLDQFGIKLELEVELIGEWTKEMDGSLQHG
jgi:UDP-N-acetylmuramate dehydrogenase